MSRDHYTYRVTWSQEDSEYLGLCLEFPSLSWLAGTPEKACRGFAEQSLTSLPTCNRTANPFPNRSLKNITAANFASAFRPSCIAPLPSRLPSRA